uniref:RING-type domain-containing protein n=1 Tax=Callorhinchus milii TaxID=7868 RepID=A0A4W3GRM4_CALMI
VEVYRNPDREVQSVVQALTEKLNCVICLEFSKVPVCLDCGHKYCRSCITGRREKQGKSSRPEYLWTAATTSVAPVSP